MRKRCEDASHSKALRAKSTEDVFSVSRQLWECARVFASLSNTANQIHRHSNELFCMISGPNPVILKMKLQRKDIYAGREDW